MAFDRKEYQRQYMRARRASDKANGKPNDKTNVVEMKPRRRPVLGVDDMLALARAAGRKPPPRPFTLPEPPPGVVPKGSKPSMAMDDSIDGQMQFLNQHVSGVFDGMAREGMLFLGYAYLSQLAQRAEYRIPTETIATEMTRKWIKFRAVKQKDSEKKAEEAEGPGVGEPGSERPEDNVEPAALARAQLSGDYAAPGEQEQSETETDDPADEKADKIKELEDEFARLEVRDLFKTVAMHDGFFGRAHIFVDLGTEGQGNRDELVTDIGDGLNDASLGKVAPGSLKALRAIEPVWTYPTYYNATNPLRDDWYNPTVWYVMGVQIHCSRLLTFVGRPVPDLLKPSYMFGGLSLSQLVQPYVQLWLDTRQNIGNLIQAFSVMVLSTDLSAQMQPGTGESMFERAALFNAGRDNAGLMVINKNTEEFQNVSAPLGGLHELQAQSQEHMMCLKVGTLIQTARGKVPIEHVTCGDFVLTREGLRSIEWVGVTGFCDTLVRIEAGGSVLYATEDHPIWSQTTKEFVSAKNVSRSHYLLVLDKRGSMASLSHGAAAGGGRPSAGIIGTKKLAAFSIEGFGRCIAGLFRTATRFITETATGLTMDGRIWSWSRAKSTRNAMIPVGAGLNASAAIEDDAWFATNCSYWPTRAESTSLVDAWNAPIESVSVIKVQRQAVYNIEVRGPPEFFANDILVHNSVVRIPAVKFTGIQPTGLNASSEGEVRVFYDTIHAYQESLFRSNLTKVMHFAMLSLWGAVDPDITFDFEPLWALSEKEEAEVRKMDAETDDILINGCAALHPEETRKRIAADPDSPYSDIDVEDVPDPPDPAEAMGGKINLKGTTPFGGGPEGGGGGGGASASEGGGGDE